MMHYTQTILESADNLRLVLLRNRRLLTEVAAMNHGHEIGQTADYAARSITDAVESYDVATHELRAVVAVHPAVDDPNHIAWVKVIDGVARDL